MFKMIGTCKVKKSATPAAVFCAAALRCALLCFVVGCTSDNEEPEFAVSRFDSWKVPASGRFLPAPRGLYSDADDNVFVLDDAGRVLVYNSQGKLTQQWEMPEFAVGKPEGIWKLLDGKIAVADTHYHRVAAVNAVHASKSPAISRVRIFIANVLPWTRFSAKTFSCGRHSIRKTDQFSCSPA